MGFVARAGELSRQLLRDLVVGKIFQVYNGFLVVRPILSKLRWINNRFV
jgi:hypothetical protein